MESCGMAKSPDWKKVAKAIKTFLNKDPADLTKSYEGASRGGEIINLNDPSLL
jgi:hypothetical protein